MKEQGGWSQESVASLEAREESATSPVTSLGEEIAPSPKPEEDPEKAEKDDAANLAIRTQAKWAEMRTEKVKEFYDQCFSEGEQIVEQYTGADALVSYAQAALENRDSLQNCFKDEGKIHDAHVREGNE